MRYNSISILHPSLTGGDQPQASGEESQDQANEHQIAQDALTLLLLIIVYAQVHQ
jgi:hypothetical protein